MHEIVVNIHMHTRYSDGAGDHHDIAAAALKRGLDAVIVTDHNILVEGYEGYFTNGQKKVLMLIGEEVHDQSRDPQKNHLLALGASREVAPFASDPESLIENIRESGGLSFIAHPTDPSAPAFNEADISWVDWSVKNFTGIEVWNGLSELKTLIPSKLHGVFYAFFPALVARRPHPETLKKWDQLLTFNRVVAIGGSDAHAFRLHLGFLSRVVYPYEFHFRAINTHLILPEPLTGDIKNDRARIYEALAKGHCFIGYDLPLSSRGFRFSGRGREQTALMGDEISSTGGVTFQTHLPSFAEIHLLKDGKVVQIARKVTSLVYHATQAGVYRIEAYRRYLGRKRGWVFSNPIYLR
jgi:predicted metal-dependent phosphoesterase TrpH